MKKRDEYQRIASITKDKSDWKQYKMLRNKINNTFKYEEKMWQKQKLLKVSYNPTKSWKMVKSILNWNGSESPSRLYHNDKIISNLKNWLIVKTNSL